MAARRDSEYLCAHPETSELIDRPGGSCGILRGIHPLPQENNYFLANVKSEEGRKEGMKEINKNKMIL